MFEGALIKNQGTLMYAGIFMTIDEINSNCTEAIFLTWKPPISLSLTTAEPDITYMSIMPQAERFH